MEHHADDTLVLEKPKKDIAFEGATRKFPGLIQEDKDFLFTSIKEVLEDDGFVGDASSERWSALAEKMKLQVLDGENPSLAGALVEYIRLSSINDTERLFHLIGPLDDFYRSLYLNDNESRVPQGSSVSLAKILSQDRIWNDPERNNTVYLFRMLNSYDLENLPTEEKTEINKQMDDFINNVKKSRINYRRLCIDDLEEALKIKQRMYHYPTSIVGSGEQIIATETDDIGWPKDPDNLSEPEQDEYDYLYRDDSPNKEEVFKESEFSKELVKTKVEEAIELAGLFKVVPEKIKPALQLHYFNNLIDEERGFGTNMHDENQEENILRRYIIDEKLAEENIYLPTVGLEIEVPYGFKVDKELCKATRDLGIPQEGAGGTNEAWEFATDFSYSAKTQILIARELIRGDFVETEAADQKKKIRGEGDFSMHLNLGFPLDLAEKINDDADFKNRFERQADVLVNALTYAFVSPERLIKRKTSSRMDLDKSAQKATKKGNRPTRLDEYEMDILSVGRLEIRSLEVRDATLYRLVPEAQSLAAALFSYETDNGDKNQELLKNIWEDFSAKVLGIFVRFNILLSSVDDSSVKAAGTLEETDIQKRLRSLITDTTQAINKIINS